MEYPTELSNFADLIFKRTYALNDNETWEGCAARVAKTIANGDATLEAEFFDVISKRKFIPGGRYLAQAGREVNQFNNCFLQIATDSREGWADLLQKHVLALSTGGGVGTYYGDIRPSGQPIKRFGGVSSGPISLMAMVNEVARHVMAGGKRRSAIWAGLPWWHEDIEQFIKAKDWDISVKALKEKDFNFPAPLDMTNISVCLDDEFFKSVKKREQTKDLYYRICKNMAKTGEPGFSVNVGDNSNEYARNPCQPAFATVLTPEGVKSFSDINVGSLIWSGIRWTQVTHKVATGIKPVYEYTTKAGSFVGTQEHRVISKGERVEVQYADTIDIAYKPEDDLSVDCLDKVTFEIKETTYLGDYPVYDITVEADEHTYWTGGLLVSNCCEVTSDTDSDVCNLGSVNLSRIDDLDDLERVTRIGTKFLYMGTFLSWLPHDAYYEVRKKHRRIGLGLMGLHEWCIMNGQGYETSGKLGKWLSAWQGASDDEATRFADQMNDVRPIAVRAIAPTGTIGIIAETTTGIEPIFCVSYKRRFLDGGKWKYSYVIDPTAERLIQQGVDPEDIEDSISLSRQVENRIAMQAFIQEFVDQAISSTINLPPYGDPGNNNVKKFSETLLKYLPKLRGITVYPDGARAGQPITPVKYATAHSKKDVVYEEDEERCAGGVCGF